MPSANRSRHAQNWGADADAPVTPADCQQPEVAQPDTEPSSDAQQLIRRGDLLLETLEKQAAAARAEAKCAELQALLAKANAGDLHPLATWLRAQDADSGCHPRAPEPMGIVDDTNKSAGWAPWLAHAQRRLEQRAAEIQRRDSAAIKTDKRSTLPQKAIGDESRKRRVDSPHDSPSLPAPHARGAQQPQRQAADARQLAELAKKFNEPLAEDERSSSEKTAYSRLWGVAASVLAHIALLVLLGIITLQLPSQVGLALKASPDALSEQQVEMSQPIEADLPDAELDVPTEPVAKFAEFLQPLEATQFDAGDALTPHDEHLSSAAAAAAGAAMAASAPMQSGASFFGAAVGGNCFCYVIDASGSMRGGAWEAAKSELLKSLASLKTTQRYYVIFFNRQLSVIPNPGESAPAPRPLYADADNLSHTRRWIETVQIGTGGPPNDALRMAIETEPDAIYLLTDGVTSVDVAGFLREHNRVEDLLGEEQIRVPIHPIAYYSLDGRELLQRIAAENLGQFIYVPDPRPR